MARPKLPLVVRFLARIKVTEGDCWNWLGNDVQPWGPRIQVAGSDQADGRTYHASVGRVAWHLFKDRKFPIRGARTFRAVRRRCFNPSCVNPAHLEVRPRR